MNHSDKFIPNKMDLSQYLTLDEPTFRQTLDSLSEAYHNDTPLVDDTTFDSLVNIYERRFGEYAEVGATVRGEKVPLPYYLSSMRKLKDDKDLDRWVRNYPGPYVLQDKVDGLTLLFTTTMTKGLPVYRLYTRGQGSIGKDVSHLVNYLSIPKLQFDVAIRGEIVMYEQDHKRLFPDNANARNTVSGIINRKQSFDPSVGPYLHFLAFRIMESTESPEIQILQLRQIGFETPWAGVSPEVTIPILVNVLQERRASSQYDIDGIVIYQNRAIDYPVGESPKQVIAYKGLSETIETIVSDVIWEASKNRLLKPVVIYNPVNISGATLQRASGYNARFILDNKIGPGARIVITRSGDTIPKIIQVIIPAENPSVPNPDIHGAYSYTGVEFVLNQDNMQVAASKLENFVRKLDIENLGPGRIKALINSGIVTVYDLLTVTPERLLQIPRFGPKLVDKIMQELRNKTTNVDLANLMAASNVFPNFSRTRAQYILDVYPNLLEMQNDPTLIDKIRSIRGIDQLAEEYVSKLPEFIAWLNAHPMITYMKPSGAINTPSETRLTTSTLEGMTIVFSGFRDKSLETQIRQRGGRVTSSVSRNTSLIVMKDITDVKGKAQKAINLGIPLISREQFSSQYIN